MKKRILVVLIVLAMTACFTACNQGSDESSKDSSNTSETSNTESKVDDSEASKKETEESSYDLGDYIDQNIKNTNSYKKMMSAGNGDVVVLKSTNYVSEYYKFDNGEIGVIDRSTEKGNEYTYLKYTEGNKMYTVDVNGKLYAESDLGENDASSDKEKFLTDLTNYLYYGLTYLGEKDGVEIYNVSTGSSEDTEEVEEGTEETDGSVDESVSNTTATSAKTETKTKTDDSEESGVITTGSEGSDASTDD